MTDTPPVAPRSLAPAAFATAVGALIGAHRLSDNSFLTHLATGRLILDHGFPRTDPYTFTAGGEPWVVQSWLASVLYALADRVGDLDGVRVLTGILAAAVALVAWRLTAPAGSPIVRLLVWAPTAVVGALYWVERPLLIGLLLLGLTLLAAQGREGDARPAFDRRWLLLVGWVWVNTHGSWPLGLVALGAIWLGRRLDRAPTADVLATLRWLGGGILLGAVNPYGPRLLVFPVELLSRRESLQLVTEWQAPRFSHPSELAFLVAVGLAVVAIRRRPSWTATLPMLGFTGAALIGARNVPVAALVLLPATARAFAGLGGFPPALVARQARLVGVAAVGLLAVAVVRVGTTDPFDDAGYPVDATAFLVAEGLTPDQVTVVTEDTTGNFFELLLGAEARTFVDDRIEVLPEAVIDDYLTLAGGEAGWDDVLARYDVDVVLWPADGALSQLLGLSAGWEQAYEDDEFVVYVATRD